jgi:serine/threonine-protein kinase
MPLSSRAAVWSVVAACVLLGALVAAMSLRSREEPVASGEAATTTAATPPTTNTTVAHTNALATAEPSTTIAPQATAAAEATTRATSAPAAATATTPSASPRPTASPAPTPEPTPKTAPQPTTAPAAPPESAASADGTLVAVAVGGSCAFSVNGASKGSGSSIKVQLKPGTYSVTCKPASGASKSKSVTLKAGSTAMAMFKL